jgi:hypothetical protein
MKRLPLILLAVALGASPAAAQELKIGGEVKTGIYWREFQDAGAPVDTNTSLHSMDDAGSGEGRIRMNFDYDNGNGFGIRIRYNQETMNQNFMDLSYAFGYGNFFDNQMTVSIGKLGGSPWGTGGPEMWKELENYTFGGMRVEWKPGFIPETAGKLNVGFILNWFNDPREAAGDQKGGDRQTLLDILQESVIGASYTHSLFMARLAYRFDSPLDQKDRGITPEDTEGGELVYRVEEYMLRKALPDLSVWALGHLQGVGSNRSDLKLFKNWLFVQYAPDLFTAQLRFGYEFMESRSRFFAKPTFYLNLFDKLLSVGASFTYAQDFGNGKIWEGSPYETIELEPKIQLNFSSSDIAFVYNWKREYINPNYDQRRNLEPIRQTQRMNLRFCIYY